MEAPSAPANGFFHFPLADILAHPLYLRLASPGSPRRRQLWLRRAAMAITPLAFVLLAKALHSPILVMLFLPALETLDLAIRATGFNDLRQSGLLRDLCLSGRSSLLTLAAYREATEDAWGYLAGCFVAAAAALKVHNQAPIIWVLLIAFAAFRIAGKALDAPVRHSVALPRNAVVAAMRSERRHLALGVAIWAAMLGFAVLPSAWLLFLAACAGVLELAIINHMLKVERPMKKMPDRELEALLEQWCVEEAP